MRSGRPRARRNGRAAGSRTPLRGSSRCGRGVARTERRVNAIVLAGGGPDAVSATVPGLPNKAFVEIGGVALVGRVIAALRSTPGVERIIAVAPTATHGHAALAAADERRADGARMVESLESGLAGAPPDDLVLVAASDLPILTA